MGNILILNGSPRAPKSNSKRYAEIFSKSCKTGADSSNISKTNHAELCRKIGAYRNVLLVFPLYADGIPVTLLNFLKTLENTPPEGKPVISVLINCGFLEYEQNSVAVDMIRFFCQENGYPFGSVLKIGSGEAILDTPFRFFAVRKIKKLAASLDSGNPVSLQVTMPISPKMFVKASTNYWINYGKRYGVSQEEMNTMEIESQN